MNKLDQQQVESLGSQRLRIRTGRLAREAQDVSPEALAAREPDELFAAAPVIDELPNGPIDCTDLSSQLE